MASETIPTISHNALVLIGDGQKALFLRNKGTAQQVKLEVEQILEQDNPATREQGAPIARDAPLPASVRREAP